MPKDFTRKRKSTAAMNTQATSTPPSKSGLTNVLATLTLVGTFATALHIVSVEAAKPAPARPAPALVPSEADRGGFFAAPPDTPNAPDPRLDPIRTTLLKNEHVALLRLRSESRSHPGDQYWAQGYQSMVCSYNLLAPSLTRQARARLGLPDHITEPVESS